MAEKDPHERSTYPGGSDSWDVGVGTTESKLFFGRNSMGGPILVDDGTGNFSLKDVKWWNGLEFLVKPLKVYVDGAWRFTADGSVPPGPNFRVGFESPGTATFPANDNRYMATQIVLTRPAR